MNNIFLKLIGAHFLVTVITIIVMSVVMDNYYLIIFFSCFLYFLSGYKVTKIKSAWFNYFGVLAIGIFFWLVCFIISPNSTNYKGNQDAGLWFFYKLYISVNSPLNFIDSLNEPYNLKRELLILFFTPFVISTFQYLGGHYKICRMEKEQRRLTNAKTHG
jgi:hypothetical protein